MHSQEWDLLQLHTFVNDTVYIDLCHCVALYRSLLYICVHALYWLFSLHACLQREDQMKPPNNTSFKPVRTRYRLWMCAHTPISSSPALITTCNLVWFYGIHQSHSSISEVIYYYIFCSWLELMKNQEQFPIRSLDLESMKWGKSTFALASEIL